MVRLGVRRGLAGRVLAGVFALAPVAGPAPAQTFSDVVAFGDSLSDGGNFAALPESRRLGVPPGSRFTTNPDPTAADLLARAFGADAGPSATGGQNRATGGACMDPQALCRYHAVPAVPEQIDAYLASRGGRADGGALYTVWGGANDIRDAMLQTGDPARAGAAAATAAAVAAGQSRRLKAAGARHIVVFNLPDIAHTPSALAAAAQLPLEVWTGLTRAYNDALAAGIARSPDGVVAIDVFALFEEVLADAAAYGFENVADAACSGPSDASLLCGPQGSGYPFAWADGDNARHLFADGIHPGGGAHALLAAAVVATLEAPVMASLAGEGGVAVAAAHGEVLARQGLADVARPAGPAGGWRAWAEASFGRQRLDALPRLGRTEADLRMATLGLSRRATADFAWGAAVSLARHDNAAGGGSARVESDAAIASLYGAWRRGGFHLGGALSFGRAGVELERRFALAAAQRLERGSTDASQLGVELALGWQGGDAVRHGPSLALSWLDQGIDAWRERGASATAMNYAAFERDSLVAEAGYGLAAELGQGLSGHARLALAKEARDDPLRIATASNTMPGRFTLRGLAPPASWAAVGFGLDGIWDEGPGGEGLRAGLNYSGRFGADSHRDHRLALALRLAF